MNTILSHKLIQPLISIISSYNIKKNTIEIGNVKLHIKTICIIEFIIGNMKKTTEHLINLLNKTKI